LGADGITFEVFQSGNSKASANRCRSPASGSICQASSSAWRIIHSNVAKYRTTIPGKDMQGQWFDGRQPHSGFVARVRKFRFSYPQIQAVF
jgi:hypothetical protein